MKFTGLVLAGIISLVSYGAQAEPILASLSTESSTGSVKYEVPGATSFKDLAWMEVVKVPNGTIVKTNSDGIARLEIFPGGKMVVMPDTTFTISNLSVETQGDKVEKRTGKIDLALGTLKALLNHKGDNTSPIDFSIKTPTCVAAARGTKYVTAVVNGVTYVEVIEGTVTAGGISIRAGEVGFVGPNGKGVITSLNDLPPEVIAALNAAVAVNVEGTATVNTPDISNQSAHSGP